MIKKSKYALCPLGNYSSSTFRYFEALLVQTLPICDEFVFSDPLASERVSEKWSIVALKRKLDPDRLIEDENQQVVYVLQIVMDSILFVRQKLSNL